MVAAFTFPFGRPVLPVVPAADDQRRVFVLGVYPSAVHAKWVGADGKQAIRAVAVDNEPEPFWTGADAAERVDAVSAELPDGAGHLEVAEQNGPSGSALAERYLAPLRLNADDCWITDLENRWLANAAQIKALSRSYQPLVDTGLLPPYKLRERTESIGLVEDRVPQLRQEWHDASPDVLITVGAEPARALGLPGPSHQHYGQPTRVTVWDRTVVHLALVHPRQAGGLGDHNSAWAATHQAWVDAPPRV